MDLEDAGTRTQFVLHLMIVLREYENFYNTHRPHRTLNQAAPLRPKSVGVTTPGPFPGPAA